MTMHTIRQQFNVSYSYPVIFTRGLFDHENSALVDLARENGRESNRALVVIDSEVARLTPGLLERISKYAQRHSPLIEFVAPPFQVRV